MQHFGGEINQMKVRYIYDSDDRELSHIGRYTRPIKQKGIHFYADIKSVISFLRFAVFSSENSCAATIKLFKAFVLCYFNDIFADVQQNNISDYPWLTRHIQ